MPYITEEAREALQAGAPSATSGELNYVITRIILEYVEMKGLSYQVINDILGALEGAKMEFYRRVVVAYEQRKCEENGEIYPT